MAFFISTPPVAGAIGDIDTTAKNLVLTTAVDNEGGGWIYLKGVASTVATDFVTYDELGITARLVRGAIGDVAVAYAATVANTWGWYKRLGSALGNTATTVVDNANVFASATTGRVDDGGYIGDQIVGAVFRSTTTANVATIQLTNPRIGFSQTGTVFSKVVPFVETVGVTTLTGTVPLPAGSHLLEISFMSTVLWGGTSASLIIGDTFDNDGWMTALDLKATDLLVGEQYSILGAGTGAALPATLGGKTPAYITTAARKGSVQTGNAATYYGVADAVIGVITQNTPSTTGRSFMVVTYSVPEVIAQVAT